MKLRRLPSLALPLVLAGIAAAGPAPDKPGRDDAPPRRPTLRLSAGSPGLRPGGGGVATGAGVLAAADFDGDGLPDLVSGAASADRPGALRIRRVRPGAWSFPSGAASPSPAPFDSEAGEIALPYSPDFIAAGDFDNDGRADLVAGKRGRTALLFLAGNGRGGFAVPREIPLPGPLSALVAGQANGMDGMTDLAAAVRVGSGARLLVFESPEGAIRAEPEAIELPDEAVAIAVSDLDGDYLGDAAVATRSALMVVQGRDRRLSARREEREAVPVPRLRTIALPSPTASMAAGRLMSGDRMAIALVGTDGVLRLAPGRDPGALQVQPGSFTGASLAGCAHIRGSDAADLIVLDGAVRRIRLVHPADRTEEALDLPAAPVAALPLRLDGDARDDLVLMIDGAEAPLAAQTDAPEAALVVTNINDSGAGSLRQAILDALGTPGSDTISFNIPGLGPFIIAPVSALPALNGSSTVDATTQPGYAGAPVVVIDGAACSGPDGLTLQGGHNVVRGLAIGHFSGNGIVIDGAGHNIVEACHIGIDPTGTLDAGNADTGIFIRHSRLNTIGGTAPGTGNVISGNDLRGIEILGSGLGASDFFSIPPGIAICDLCTVSLPIAVPLEERIADVNAGVNLMHTWDGDLRLTLIAPDGARVLLSDRRGGSGDNYSGTTFDDEGFVPISAAFPPFSGVFQPEQPLSSLDGKITLGTWWLEVADVGAGDSGFFSNWTLSFRSGETFGNVIEGNRIGTNAGGTIGIGNTRNVVIEHSPGNLVGGVAAGARNLISSGTEGASGDGVAISGNLAIQNLVQGNSIGTDVTGMLAIPNAASGVHFSGVHDCLVGGTAAGAGNLLSGNSANGVLVEQSDSNDIQGNRIGTTAAGTAALPNGGIINGNGIRITDGSLNLVGGSSAAARNVISGNMDQGVTVWDVTPGCCGGNSILGNYLGTDPTGLSAVPNWHGAYLVNTQVVFFGGAGPGEGNLVSGNTGVGVNARGLVDSVLAGNIIGLDRTASAKLPNGLGVAVEQSARVTIGGSAAGAGNTISGNAQDGVWVYESASSRFSVTPSGDTPKAIPDLATISSTIAIPSDAPIQHVGVRVSLTHTFDSDLVLTLIGPDGSRLLLSNRRGGSGDNYTNTLFDDFTFPPPISSGSAPFTGTFSAEEPMWLFNGATSAGSWTLEVSDVAGGDVGTLWGWSLELTTVDPGRERILGNFIGTNAAGAAGLGNAFHGIEGKLLSSLQVGGPLAGEGNVISGNGLDGVHLESGVGYTAGSVVQGNRIGVKPDGVTPLGNGGAGVSAFGMIGTIGGPGPAFGNVIAHNADAGVQVSPTNTPKQAAIRGNSIHDNGGLGIDLLPNGVTLNDPADGDAGANLLQNFPVVTSVTPMGGGTLISGTLSSAPGSKFTIDVYSSPAADPSGYGEGENWLGSTAVVTDGAGNAGWTNFTPSTGLGFVAATATDFVGNTSEFSGAFSNPQEASPAGDMRLAPAGGTSVQMTWTPACGATDHAAYWGTAGPGPISGGSLGFTKAACGLGIGGTATFDPGNPAAEEFFYFVIAGQNFAVEGSYGVASSGVERPEATLPIICDRPQALGGVCP